MIIFSKGFCLDFFEYCIFVGNRFQLFHGLESRFHEPSLLTWLLCNNDEYTDRPKVSEQKDPFEYIFLPTTSGSEQIVRFDSMLIQTKTFLLCVDVCYSLFFLL